MRQIFILSCSDERLLREGMPHFQVYTAEELGPCHFLSIPSVPCLLPRYEGSPKPCKCTHRERERAEVLLVTAVGKCSPYDLSGADLTKL